MRWNRTNRSWMHGAFCLLALAFTGCEPEAKAATALVLSVKARLEDLASVEVAVFEGDADPSADAPGDDQTKTVSASAEGALAMVIERGKANEVLLAVRGLDRRGRRLAETRLRARFVSGRSLAVPVFLGGACTGVFCEDEPRQTCYPEPSGDTEAGECGSIPLVRNLNELIDPARAEDALHDWPEPEDIDAGAEEGEAGLDADAPDASVSDGAGPDAQVDACAKPALDAAVCGLAPQCGCASGQSCRLNGPRATVCRTASPPGPTPTIACTTHSQCPAGYDCIGSRCAAYCSVDADCGAGGICIDVNDEGTPISGARACLVACNTTTGVPCGTGTTCTSVADEIVSGRTINGDFCLAPAPNQCMPSTPPGGTCDLVRQCGCSSGQACGETLSGGTVSVSCRAPGTTPAGATCSQSTQCVAGHACVGGLCQRYCKDNSDCSSVGSMGGRCLDVQNASGQALPGFRTCVTNCSVSSGQPCGPGSSCAQIAQPTCVAPYTTCPASLIGNGRCDGPEGTRLCASGTDPDCSAMCTPAPSNPPGGTCDLVRQCGCASGQSCKHSSSGGVATIACQAPGTLAPGAPCTSTSACPAAHACVDGLCSKYCKENADCGTNGLCFQVTSGGQDVAGVKTCGVSCSPSVAASCPAGYVCANPAKPFCAMPLAQCPSSFLNDGICDEPEGTRLCVEGTDVADCT